MAVSCPATNADTAPPTAPATADTRPGWENRSGINPPITEPTLATTPGDASNPATAAPTASPTIGATGFPTNKPATNSDTVCAANCCTSGFVPRSAISPEMLVPNAFHTEESANNPFRASVVNAPRPSWTAALD